VVSSSPPEQSLSPLFVLATPFSESKDLGISGFGVVVWGLWPFSGAIWGGLEIRVLCGFWGSGN
jgi:hypothetical protein